MRKNLLLLFSFLIVQFTFSQKYFDKDWKETTRSNASFYRIMPMKEVGELVLMQDFYMDGTPQFEGYVYKTDEDSYVGDISYYDADGNDETFRQYTNSTENSVLNYYHTNGKIRKRSIYKNGVKNGETNIYGEDGKLLMTGIYAEGKPVKGDFESFNDDYQNDKREDDQINEIENIPTNEENIKTPTYTPPPPPSTVPRDQAVYVKPIPTSEPKKKVDLKNRKTIALKIFWAKNNKLAQEKLYEIREYDRDLIQQKNYDSNGKLIQTLDEENIEYGHRLKNGIEYEYFLHNNFATGVRSSTIYKDEKKEGKKIAYFPNGKIASETIYKEDLEIGEEIIYKENGEIDKKRTYKKGEPYSGNFDDKIGFLKINYNYSNGKKEGEAIAKVEDGKIVAKGIYKNNEPFNGTFVVEKEYGDENELINVENFKKTGLQTEFNYRLEDIVKTYTIKNDKLNGLTTFYDDEKPIATLEYKNDLPFEGTLLEKRQSTIFKNGKMVSENIYRSDYNKTIAKTKMYENGVLSKVIDHSFVIPEDPKESYETTFKNGKPFSGYYINDEDSEFKNVIFYENGAPKFQYSNDYLKNMDNYEYQAYNIKSSFKNGKIYDGVEYIPGERSLILKYWKNGVLQSFDFDMFAVNYFNRIHFELKGNDINIEDLQEKTKAIIRIENIGNTISQKLLLNNEVIFYSTIPSSEKISVTKDHQIIVLYYEEDGKIASKTIDIAIKLADELKGSDFMAKIFFSLNDKHKTAKEVFENLGETVGSEKFLTESENDTMISGMRYEYSDKPSNGILINETGNNSYTLQSYREGKLMKTQKDVPFQNVKILAKKMEHDLYNE